MEISNGRSMAFALFTLCRCPYHNGVSPSGRDCRGHGKGAPPTQAHPNGMASACTILQVVVHDCMTRRVGHGWSGTAVDRVVISVSGAVCESMRLVSRASASLSRRLSDIANAPHRLQQTDGDCKAVISSAESSFDSEYGRVVSASRCKGLKTEFRLMPGVNCRSRMPLVRI